MAALNRRHFILRHNAGKPHAGIIACTFHPDFASPAQRVDEALVAQRDMRGK